MKYDFEKKAHFAKVFIRTLIVSQWPLFKLELTFNSHLKRSNLTPNYTIMKYVRSISASLLILFASFAITLYYECKKEKKLQGKMQKV